MYELYHNGTQTSAERVVSHDIGDACISNLIGWTSIEEKNSQMKFSPEIHLALGQEEKCLLLKLTPKVDSALPIDEISLDSVGNDEEDENENSG